MKLPAILFILFLLLSGASCKKNGPTPPLPETGKEFASVVEINQRLGRGINLSGKEADKSWEPAFSLTDLQRIAALGFTHVRIPVRWERNDRSSTSAPYTIQPAFMQTIKGIVDEALKNKLHVIINMHHHELLYAYPPTYKAMFLSQWQQIATHFKDYPDSLLFEIMNEPHGNLTPELWNSYAAEALQTMRQTNPKRTVLLGVADYGGLGGLSSLQIPNDKQLILSVHYYNPFNFTHQGAGWVENSDPWLGTKWRDTEFERQAVQNEFSHAIAKAKEANIPIHVGEFGAYEKADLDSRVRWTRFMARWFEQQGFSWAYWEFNAGFGIYNPQTGQYNSALVNALLHDPLPSPAPVNLKNLYSSNFSNGPDGWIRVQQATANGVLTQAGGALQVAINNPGTETWHLQLIKSGFRLEKDKTYHIALEAEAMANKTLTIGFQQNTAPWQFYGGGSIEITNKPGIYHLVFNATINDPAANFVISLGRTNNGPVTIKAVKWDELSY